MAEYIEREALLTKIAKLDVAGVFTASFKDATLKIISEHPAVDVAEVRHGKWLLECEPNGKPYCYHCSICDGDFHYIGITMASDYCPNCGAKMGNDEE